MRAAQAIDGPALVARIVRRTALRPTMLRGDFGARCTDKVEGIALLPDHPTRGWVVIDRDTPDHAPELCEGARGIVVRDHGAASAN